MSIASSRLGHILEVASFQSLSAIVLISTCTILRSYHHAEICLRDGRHVFYRQHGTVGKGLAFAFQHACRRGDALIMGHIAVEVVGSCRYLILAGTPMAATLIEVLLIAAGHSLRKEHANRRLCIAIQRIARRLCPRPVHRPIGPISPISRIGPHGLLVPSHIALQLHRRGCRRRCSRLVGRRAPHEPQAH